MTARLAALNVFTCLTSAFVLTVGRAAPASAQAPGSPTRDTAAAPVRDLPLTAAQRQVFVGTYSVILPPDGERTLLRVFEENGVLKARPANQDGTRRLLYQGDNVFAVEGAPDLQLTFVVEHGRAVKFTGHKADGPMEGERIE